MKRSYLVLFFLVFMASAVWATPPKSINIKIKSDIYRGAQVEIIVHHETTNPNKHFIEELLVERNGRPMIRQYFLRQTNNLIQRVIYLMPSLDPGDKIDVVVLCTQDGVLRQSAIYK